MLTSEFAANFPLDRAAWDQPPVRCWLPPFSAASLPQLLGSPREQGRAAETLLKVLAQSLGGGK